VATGLWPPWPPSSVPTQRQSLDPASVTEAVRSPCPDDLAALMMACQVLGLAAMTAARSPESAVKACGRMVAALDRWLR
jgi:hypothetical protein